MGFTDLIKGLFKRDKEVQAASVAKGTSVASNVSMVGLDPSSSGSEGVGALQNQLAIEQDLVSRYIDYENMDDYVETCLAGDSLVFTVERGWVQIQELAEAQEEFHVLAYDRDLKSLVPAKGCDARLTGETGHEKPMVRVVLSGGRSIRCTVDHRFMGRDGDWTEAANLSKGQRLMPVEHDLLSKSEDRWVASVSVIDGGEAVYDLTVPGYANFVCNGVVVHNSVALDVYADDATIPDTLNKRTVWATSEDKLVRDIINDMLHRMVRIDEDVWVSVRNLAKYGNLYAETLVTKGGLIGLNWLPAPSVRRIVNTKGILLGFIQDVTGQFNYDLEALIKALDEGKTPIPEGEDKEGVVFFHPWELIHWRLRSKQIRSPYGYGILDSSRWIWKRLQLMEDTALVQKLTRAPGRYAFYVDTGDLPPREAVALVRKVKSGFKKKRLIDPTTGQLDLRNNPLSPQEDFWIPTRGGKDSTRIEVISGPDVQMMDDVEYFQGKLVTSTKVPRRYMGLGDPGDTTNIMASQEDVRFARACMRVQREYIQGLQKAARIHLAALNIDPDSVPWTINMTVPSAIFEMQQIEIMNAQAGLAASLADYMSKPWILQRVFNMSKDEAQGMVQAKRDEDSGDIIRDADAQAKVLKLYPELEGMLDDGQEAQESVAPKGSVFSEDNSEKMLKAVNKKVHAIERGIVRLNKTTRINASGKQRRQ